MTIVQKFVVLSALASFVVAPAALATNTVEAKSMKTEKLTLTAEQRACVVTALTKRENALVASEQAFESSWKKALETRRDSLVVAWGKETRSERIVAQRAAIAAFQASKRAARATELSARRLAWSTFKTERQACSPNAAREDVVSSNLDS